MDHHSQQLLTTGFLVIPAAGIISLSPLTFAITVISAPFRRWFWVPITWIQILALPLTPTG